MSHFFSDVDLVKVSLDHILIHKCKDEQDDMNELK